MRYLLGSRGSTSAWKMEEMSWYTVYHYLFPISSWCSWDYDCLEDSGWWWVLLSRSICICFLSWKLVIFFYQYSVTNVKVALRPIVISMNYLIFLTNLEKLECDRMSKDQMMKTKNRLDIDLTKCWCIIENLIYNWVWHITMSTGWA